MALTRRKIKKIINGMQEENVLDHTRQKKTPVKTMVKKTNKTNLVYKILR